jgi:predicted RNase H-like nuclease (RuvC/YqgF family)
LPKDIKSQRSTNSKKVVRHLANQLEDEREARRKLEREIEEIRKLNNELSTSIGLLVK